MCFPQAPTPGSNEAIEEGCTCPVLSNNKGKGTGLTDDDGNLLFWKSADCPLHGTGLKLAYIDELSHTSNADYLAEDVSPNPSNYVE